MTTVRAPTGHDDLIHDAQLDYYGLRLATCSSDRVVKIFDLISQDGAAPKVQFSCDLLGHTGPVWEVAWAHPRWGNLLASCSYDATVIIHRLNEGGAWEEAFRHSAKGSVNSIEWCPYEYGLALACASSDSFIYVLRCDVTTGVWSVEKEIVADRLGCSAVTWAPYGALGSVGADGRSIMRLATGGVDQKVKIFKCEIDPSGLAIWGNDPEVVLDHHHDCVRDVAWAPSIGLPYNLLASCSEDGSVCIWSQESEHDKKWEKEVLPTFKATVWRVAWSVTGSLLAVSAGDADVSLWKESLEEKKWIKVSEVKDKSANQPPQATVPQAQENKTTTMPSSQPPAASSSPRNADHKDIASDTLRPEVPIVESETERPATTWESAPQQEEPAQGTQEWPQDQQPEAWTTGGQNPDSQPTDPTYDAVQGDNQASYPAGGEYGYDPNQAYDPNQQYYAGYEGQQAYDPNQQTYYGGDGYDPNQAYYGEQQQGGGEGGQYWDPNHPQEGYAGYSEQQGGETQYWDQQQQQQAPASGYGLAAAPVNAGATYSHQQYQPPATGAAQQQQQKPW